MTSPTTKAFLDRTLDPAAFGHRDHLEVAFDPLQDRAFEDAVQCYASGLRDIATAAGVPEKFNLTITYAFMSLVAERLGDGSPVHNDFNGFIAAHADLMDRSILHRWYSPDRLGSTAARMRYILPDRAPDDAANNALY
ncbi:MAG: hypothetical protein AAFO58_04785 [Pseudomonadota bacterium]